MMLPVARWTARGSVHESMRHSGVPGGFHAGGSGRRMRPSAAGVASVALCAVLAFEVHPVLAFPESSCPGIHVRVLNIRNSTGAVACALFESPAGFPTGFLRSATNIVIMKIRDTQARCDLKTSRPERMRSP